MNKMTHPAPNCMSILGNNGWYSQPWTLAAVAEYLSIGGFFMPNKHDFADPLAAKLAINPIAFQAQLEASLEDL